MKPQTPSHPKPPNGFDQRDAAGDAYWVDPRWAEVRVLHAQGAHDAANDLVFQIRESWGVE